MIFMPLALKSTSLYVTVSFFFSSSLACLPSVDPFISTVITSPFSFCLFCFYYFIIIWLFVPLLIIFSFFSLSSLFFKLLSFILFNGYLEVITFMDGLASLEDVAHDEEANLPSLVGLHPVQPEELWQ